MITLTSGLRARDVRRVRRALGGYSKRLPGQLAIAINETTKKTKTHISREVRQELNITARDLNKVLKVKKAHKTNLHARVVLEHEKRLSLKRFSPRQTKKGVTYKVSKRGGRQLAPSAFMGPKPGAVAVKLRGHVFKRLTKKRYPIVRLDGASAWASYIKNRLDPPTKRFVRKELKKQIRRRARYLTLKRKGKL